MASQLIHQDGTKCAGETCAWAGMKSHVSGLIFCPVRAPSPNAVQLNPRCGANIQLTRKTYWTIDGTDGYLFQEQTDQPDMWVVYCENDHQLYGNEDGIELNETTLVADLLDLFRDHPPTGG